MWFSATTHVPAPGDWCIICGMDRGPVMRVRGRVREIETVIRSL